MANSRSRNSKPQNPVFCTWPGCNKSFTREADKERHRLNIHLKQKCLCPFPECREKAFRADKLKEHERKRHQPKQKGNKTGDKNRKAGRSSGRATFRISKAALARTTSDTILHKSTESMIQTTTPSVDLCEALLMEMNVDDEATIRMADVMCPPYILGPQADFPMAHAKALFELDTSSLQKALDEAIAASRDWMKDESANADM
ncbi:uncharacterized protein LY89DRAFT_476177 [Mollisia scopiformis]|uniref:C2H2-type domain-containing protein n=1 Tax=Mollisia scopiformis TaxID=149040 RepID=A0A194XFU7_MOLSC|nr:uncharacterized protein LY89DRAFT_476177 [Mollisia scopiformis]KUJ19070.1 hypothetical protein LY89DRAFT_476177 [Mollisia scopiformis]